MTHAASLLVALLLDGWFGEPRALWSRVPHPAVVMGRAIGWADHRFNYGKFRRIAGSGLVVALVIVSCCVAVLIEALPGGNVIATLLAASLLAQRSLVDHVQAVADALRLSPGDGRLAVARIVGRDTAEMEQSAVARAAIESAAENLSDGVVAPAFWFLLGGLPGLLIYKALNTADSMIGYRTPRHEDFGWAAARLDDALNWIPARLTAFLIALIGKRLDAWSAIRRDARLHRSPNAGWPEAAMAVVLDVSLAGPRSYDGQMRDFDLVHPQGRRDIGPDEIDASVSMLWKTWLLLVVLVAVLALI